ncbi:MAG: glycosyltransferase family 39 protein [Caldilineaceae bacterium]
MFDSTLQSKLTQAADSSNSQGNPAQDEVRIQIGSHSFSLRAALLAIIIVSVGLRVVSALFQGNAIDTLPGVWDQVSYDGLARRLLDGHGFSFGEPWWPATRANEPTAHWSYLYTLFLTGLYAVAGAQPLLARLLQALIVGVLHPWLAWRLGKRVFGPSAGILAAFFSAIYIYFFYYGGALVTETMYITALLWMFDVALRLYDRPFETPWRWIELGLAIGVAALLRQLVLLYVPFLFLWLWWRTGALHASQHNRPQIEGAYSGLNYEGKLSVRLRRMFSMRSLSGFVYATIIVFMLIIPWTVRNYLAFGTFTPLNTNAGYVLFWGNHPIYGTHFVGILPGETAYYDLIPKELLPLNEAALDQALLKVGLGFITADPVRYFWLSLSRIAEYFKFWPSAESGTISNLSRVASFGIFLPLIIYGLWSAFFTWRKQLQPEQQSATFLLLSFVLIYTAMHLLTWALVRYRLPVDAIFLLFAAFGAQNLLNRNQIV